MTIMDINIDSLREVDAIYQGRMHTLMASPLSIREALTTADVVVGAVLLTLALLLAVQGLITGGSLFVLLLVLLLLAVSFAFLYPQYRYAAQSDNLWDART